MRTITTQLLLCFVMLFHSIAGAMTPGCHCPMQQSGNASVMAMGDSATHDCCHDLQAAAKPGHTCNNGPACHMSVAFAVTFPPSIMPAPDLSQPQPAPQPDKLLPVITSVWRPPISV